MIRSATLYQFHSRGDTAHLSGCQTPVGEEPS